MVRTIIFLILLATISCNSIDQPKDKSFRIMTYNIRYMNENPGEEWSLRRSKVAEMIRFHQPDIFGLQEALKEQVDYIAGEFDTYKWVGVGRDDGLEGGEFSPIFFSSDFQLLKDTTIWLSPTPTKPSQGWDAALNRIATIAFLQNLNSNDTLLIINTHFDHIGILAREESAKLILKTLENLAKQDPVILMGDFNVTDTSRTYNTLNTGPLRDAQVISKFPNYGTNITFNGFQDSLENGEKIDFVFTNDKINVLHHAIIGDKLDNRYPSDHMPVVVDFKINKY